ncbi:hypothetical protein FCM35_KLT03008 [Carex littledalei]|uniref:Uncharacterized protein n=1 Tax=Carex littledalei TaxID=544730 RepID=A0A833VAZ0_9POAL|nr:hypothetical protein FCM35_KLT03008 [Carex littledalei]
MEFFGKKTILLERTRFALYSTAYTYSLIMCTARPLNEQKWAQARDLLLEVLPKGIPPPDDSNCSHSVTGGFCPPP